MLDRVDFAPATAVGEVIQNVRTILATRIGTVPLDRGFGLTWKYLDQPIQVSKMTLHAEIIEAVNQYEPRATVTSVSYANGIDDSMDGILKPIVKIRINAVRLDKALPAYVPEADDYVPYRIVEIEYAEGSGGTVEPKTPLELAIELDDRLRLIERSDYTLLYMAGEVKAEAEPKEEETRTVVEIVADIEERLADIEQTDYTQMFITGGDSEPVGQIPVTQSIKERLESIEIRISDIERSFYRQLYWKGEN